MQIIQVQDQPAICTACDKGISVWGPKETPSQGGWAVADYLFEAIQKVPN